MYHQKFTLWVVLCLAVATRGFPLNPYEEKDLTKKHYSFSYGVKDDYMGLDFSQDEKSDGNAVHGSYSVKLPDGRIQTVTYRADHEKGFLAEVTYEGQATYPDDTNNTPYAIHSNDPEPLPIKATDLLEPVEEEVSPIHEHIEPDYSDPIQEIHPVDIPQVVEEEDYFVVPESVPESADEFIPVHPPADIYIPEDAQIVEEIH